MLASGVTSLGGSMYGDGEYVVQFEGGRGTQAPLSAILLVESAVRSVEFDAEHQIGNKALAEKVIRLARLQDGREEVQS
jgi:hypothetical protein